MLTLYLNILVRFFPLEQISLRDLTFKAITLIALTSSSRAQSLHLMNTEVMDINDHRIRFFFNKLLKNSKAGSPHQFIEVRRYNNNPELCVFSTIMEYMSRTKDLGHHRQFGLVSESLISQFVLKQLVDGLKQL